MLFDFNGRPIEPTAAEPQSAVQPDMTISARLASDGHGIFATLSKTVDVDMHKVAVDMYKMEKDQYWVRCNVFLLLNSALLVAYQSEHNGPGFAIILSTAGALLSVAWLAISMHSEYYIKRWREIIRNIETSLPIQPFLSFPKDSVNFAPPSINLYRLILSPVHWFARGGPSRIMNGVIIVFIVVWILLGSIAKFRSSSESFPYTQPKQAPHLERLNVKTS